MSDFYYFSVETIGDRANTFGVKIAANHLEDIDEDDHEEEVVDLLKRKSLADDDYENWGDSTIESIEKDDFLGFPSGDKIIIAANFS